MIEYKCCVCGKTDTDESYRCVCNDCVAESMRPLTNGQYMYWLNTMYTLISHGLKLTYFDDTTISDKDTWCSWGMCNENPVAYSPGAWQHPGKTQPNDHTERVHVVRRDRHQYCPFDVRANLVIDQANWGCFYHCSIFQHRMEDRVEALRLISERRRAVRHRGAQTPAPGIDRIDQEKVTGTRLETIKRRLAAWRTFVKRATRVATGW